jgi:TIR domain
MSGTIGRIFISHSSRDRHIAETLCAALEKRGLPCWISSRDVAGGDNYQEAVFRAIRSAKVMVLVFTANANRSDEIKKELALASQSRLIVIPLRAENVTPDAAFAFELATRQYIDAFPDWERGLQLLAIRITSVASAASDETVLLQSHDVPLTDATDTPGGSVGAALAAAVAQARAATVELTRTASATTLLGMASGVLLAVILFAWLLWPKPPPVPVSQVSAPSVSPIATPVPTVAPPAEFRFETADETEIRDHVPTGLSLFRFALNPQIVVLDFASLREQGLMLNRVAALVEKVGLPRDRVLSDTELDSAIRAGGDTVETFYYGHDYSAAELARFFATADQDGVHLNPEEEMLRLILRQLRWFAPGVHAGLVSIPKVGANEQVTYAAHRTILHNELAHGEYFSNPAYAAFVHQFWTTALTPEEHDNVRRFLGSEDYDTSINELVEDNMQAYLMFSRDPAFFTPAMVSMTAARLADLQTAFLRDMPSGWLHDMLATSLLVQQLTPTTAR